MGVVLACILMVLVALAAAYRWRGLELRTPPRPAPPTRGDRARRYLWWLELVLATVVLTGTFVVGAGGRLAMRVLGATGGDAAQGRLTEASEVVGEVTLEGTIGFFLFVGLTFGLVSTLAWFALRPFLPGRWIGGLALGAGVFVVLGTRNDPLRPDNPDFDLLGPWWLSITVFAALALAQGVAIATVAARTSRWLPLPGRDRRSWSYALLLLLVVVFPLGILAGVVGLAYVFGGPALDRLHARAGRARPLAVGRYALVALVLVAAPGFVADLSELVGRGP